MRLVEHVERKGRREMCTKNLAANPEGRRPPGRVRLDWRIILRNTGFGGMNPITEE